MAEHDTERVDAGKEARRSKTNLPLGDRKKAVAEPDANQLREGSQAAGAEALLGLQQTHGNAYVQRLLKSRKLQAKLTVNPPDDQYEREADQVAETVTKTTDVQREAQPEEEEEKVQAKLQRQAVPEEEEKVQTKLQRQAKPEEEEENLQTKLQRQANEEEEEKVQTKGAGATPEVTEALEERINAARGTGQALPDSLRSTIEPKLGHDFSQVRLHTDAEADGLSRQLGAKAFTTGQDVFFREGDYHPDSQEGRSLIGHELAHVVQQGAAAVARQEAEAGKQTEAAAGAGQAGAESKGATSEEKFISIGGAADINPDIQKAIDALEPFFKEVKLKVTVTSGVRTPDYQLGIIRGFAIDLGLDKTFPKILNATVDDVESWRPCWDEVLKHKVVNPPKGAKSSKGFIPESPHIGGKAFDLSGAGLSDIETVVNKCKSAGGPIGQVKTEDQNGCVHVGVK
jgi:hypothetical protein